MNKTKIEWSDSSWNPISGCYHDCEYCYARRTANRFKGCDASPSGEAPKPIMKLTERLQVTDRNGITRNAAYPYGFTPTLHTYRLDDPCTKGFGKTIFVCSMADMFGAWIPDEWIKMVFDACEKAPNHRYLFLTKNPKRYIQLAEKGLLPNGDNFWYGSTATTPDADVFWSKEHHTFVSIEPILAPFTESDGDLVEKVDWAIFGAETGKRADKVIPHKDWLETAVQIFQRAGKPVFMKDSLIPIWGENILTQFPWLD